MTEAVPPRVAPSWQGKRVFRVCFLILAGLYAGLLLFWGRHDLGRIQSQYRQATERLGGGYAQARAEIEITAGCRQAVGGESSPAYGDCLRASAHLIQKRAVVLSGELQRERRQVIKKMVLFALLVGGLLITLPLALLYGGLVFLMELLNNLRFKND